MKKFFSLTLICLVSIIWFSLLWKPVVLAWSSIITFEVNKGMFSEDNESDKDDTSKIMKRENIEPITDSDKNPSVIQRIIDAFNIWAFNANWVNTEWGTNYVKAVINYALWFLAFIALFIIIFWFFRMFFSGNHQESFDKAKKIVYTAAIALIIIWVSWIVISWMFRIFFQIKWPSY